MDLIPANVLYEDEDLIAVSKPAGLPSHGTHGAKSDHLVAALERFLMARDSLREPPYLALHHRLDRDTSGVVLLAKTKRFNAAISDQFAGREIGKLYSALTGPGPAPGETWSVENYLRSVKGKGRERRMEVVQSGGDFAHTDFRVRKTFPRGLWIEAIPHTGRTHQIRVHLAGSGLPILGEDLYGRPPRSPARRLMLHAYELAFRHPADGRELRVRAPLAKDFRRAIDWLLKGR